MLNFVLSEMPAVISLKGKSIHRLALFQHRLMHIFTKMPWHSSQLSVQLKYSFSCLKLTSNRLFFIKLYSPNTYYDYIYDWLFHQTYEKNGFGRNRKRKIPSDLKSFSKLKQKGCVYHITCTRNPASDGTKCICSSIGQFCEN